MSINPKVSVIIPVYKAEQYIEKCARSLFEQTLDDIEFIFIDDCTPDNSIDILKCLIRDYPHRKSQVKIIHNEENKGISTTRNIGLNNSTGEYIIHCDSDDWIDDDLYEKLYLKAIEEKSDIVLCDFIREESGNLKIRKEFLNENVEEYVKAILTTKLSPYLWNKLVSRNLYLKYNIFFPDGINIREDFYALVKLFYYSKKISRISDSYYHYRIHGHSISRHKNMRDFNSVFVQDRIKASVLAYDFLMNTDDKVKYEKAILDSKLILKIRIITKMYGVKKAREIFPETDSKIFSSNLSLHHKIHIWLLSKKINIFFRIYKIYLSVRY
jgi:glycosyltransferase involved in cell wall biosynthesis